MQQQVPRGIEFQHNSTVGNIRPARHGDRRGGSATGGTDRGQIKDVDVIVEGLALDVILRLVQADT
jgi:hypothetical protein